MTSGKRLQQTVCTIATILVKIVYKLVEFFIIFIVLDIFVLFGLKLVSNVYKVYLDILLMQNSTPGKHNNNFRQVGDSVVLKVIRKKIKRKMDLVFDAYLASDSDFPQCDSAIWVFGRSYSIRFDMEELRRCVSSCLWFSYRKGFPAIGETSFTSDRGWGCMIRCGQMVLAKALILRYLGQGWHWGKLTSDLPYLQLLSLFEDTNEALFSLHKIAISGAGIGKPVGSWLGPNTVTQSIKKLLAQRSSPVDLEVYTAMDSTLIISDIKKNCTSKPTPGRRPVDASSHSFSQDFVTWTTPRKTPSWKPLLLVVPLRLGLTDLNASYIPGLKAVFELPQNIGIIGGRPNHALFFIGYAEDEVLYLDPHSVQQTMKVNLKSEGSERTADESYHTSKPGRMRFNAMDPSLAVCFYCDTEAELDSLCSRLRDRFQLIHLPLFEICDQMPESWALAYADCENHDSFTESTSDMSFEGSSSSFTIPANLNVKGQLYPKLNLSRNSSGSSLSNNSKYEPDDEEFEILG